jgi:hypothetical protein
MKISLKFKITFTKLLGNEGYSPSVSQKTALREIAMIKPAPILPVKTRLPIQAWIFAGLVTLFSIASSLTHLNVPPHSAVYAGVSYAQPLSRGL